MRVFWIAMALMLAASGCSQPGSPSEADPVGGASPETAVSGEAMGDHVHDLWQGATELTLMDNDVTVTLAHNHLFDEPPRPEHLHNCAEELASTAQGGSVTFTLPQGEIVPPGTSRLDVSFDWSDATIGSLRFFYRPPSHGHLASGDGHDHSNLTDAGLITNDGTIEIEVMEGMADVGHDARSHWAFYLCADAADPGISQGAVRMNVQAFRTAELTPDAPHPDHWGNQTSLHLATYSWSGQTWSAANQGETNWHHLVFHGGSTVPMGTRTVVVDAWLNGTGSAVPAPPELMLYYHDAAQVDWIYRVVEPLSSSNGHWLFEISLEDEDGWDAVDSPYASVTFWDLWLRIVSDVNAAGPLGLGRHGEPLLTDATLEAAVVATSW